jgi:hypothetical protein
MRKFSSQSSLYRRFCLSVIFAVVAASLWQIALAQVSRPKVSKGPRALGLLQLLPGGKARLVPVVILIDGQYYDAGAYKASPVPMALWAETEYEGFRTGISQGLFTVTAALENQKTNEWIAEGSWQTAESLAAKATKKPGSSIPRGLEDDSGPPVLRHSGAKPKPPEPAPASTTAPASTQTQPAAPANTPPAPAPSSPSPTAPAPAPTTTASSTPAPNPDEQDPNKPTLKRGKPAPAPAEPDIPPTTPAPKKSSDHPFTGSASAQTPQPELIPAISDADGPEVHSYIYDMKPDEESALRAKMLALAADELQARVKQLASEQVGSSKPAAGGAKSRAAHARTAQPAFDDVQFRVFDLSSSNEPTMVLTAKARMERSAQSAETELQYFVTLVARQDINGDVHKAFVNVTDTQHLDIEPKLQLVDAVDVDGDGRAELLFRRIYDVGSAYVVYRVIGDQLYPLFEGVPTGESASGG